MNSAFYGVLKDCQTLDLIQPTNFQNNQPQFQIRESDSVQITEMALKT